MPPYRSRWEAPREIQNAARWRPDARTRLEEVERCPWLRTWAAPRRDHSRSTGTARNRVTMECRNSNQTLCRLVRDGVAECNRFSRDRLIRGAIFQEPRC